MDIMYILYLYIYTSHIQVGHMYVTIYIGNHIIWRIIYNNKNHNGNIYLQSMLLQQAPTS